MDIAKIRKKLYGVNPVRDIKNAACVSKISNGVKTMKENMRMPKEIPLMDIGLQYKELKGDIDRVMVDIAQRSSFILGKETKAFERQMCGYCNVKYAVGVASGTDALILSLTAVGITAGDEVITTPFTFIATAEAISRVGAVPVFVDIDRKTYNVDPAKIEKAITPNTKAIIPVHIYGNPCDMERISEIAKKNKLKVIEDAAQAIGATYNGQKIGSFGDAGCFSFYPGKNLGAFGDAGMVITKDKAIAEKIRMLRAHGSVSKYRHSLIGFNSRLDSLQAAILSIKLAKLDEWNAKRRNIAARYSSALKDVVTVPSEQDKGGHVYHLYVIKVQREKRDSLLNFLNEKGIGARVYYPIPLHLQKCYRGLGYKEGDFPESESGTLGTLALPVFPGLKEKEQDYIIDTVKKGLKEI